MKDTRLIIYCLERKGVRQSNIGFMYIKELLEMMTEDQKPNKMNDYYDKLSRKYSVKPTNIERAIRYSITNSGMSNKEFVYHLYNEIMCWTIAEKSQLQQSTKPKSMDLI